MQHVFFYDLTILQHLEKDFFKTKVASELYEGFPGTLEKKNDKKYLKKIVLVEEEISLPCLKMQQKSGGKKYGNYLQLSRYDKLYASRQKLLMQLFFRHHFCETNFGY